MIDLSGADVPVSAYLAAILSIVGLGLLAGAWYGRARWLIAVGAGLSVLLVIAAAAEAIGPANGVATWRPASIDQVESSYHVDLGNATLDLTGVKFAGYEKAVTVTVGAGNLTIIVPPEVDVRAEAKVDMGNAGVFGTRWGGMGQSVRTILDEGVDGPGGGRLILRASVDMGNLEVKR